MSAELFPDSEVTALSPRLVWLKLHNLALGELPYGVRFCASKDCIKTGDTHSDCEMLMADELEVEHWSVTDFAKAGVVMPGNVQEEQC